MTRRFLVALALIAGTLGLTSPPASAHNHSNLSVLFCVAGAQNPQTQVFLAHSWPLYMDQDVVIFWCAAFLGDQYRTYRVWVSTHDGSYIATNWCNPNIFTCSDEHPPSP